MSDAFVFPSSLPAVPLARPTRESIEAELAVMGRTATPVAPADLMADGREMLAARADIAELEARGYAVSEGLIDRVALLVALSQEALVTRALDRAATAPILADDPEASRVRLLEIRRELGAKAAAAGLPPDLFVLGSSRSNRLNVVLLRVGQVLGHAERLLDRLPDRARAAALIAEGQALIAAQHDRRAEARIKRAGLAGDTQRLERLERLLLDALIYLSRQGLDAGREPPSCAGQKPAVR